MGQAVEEKRFVAPFNGAVEIGLRAIVILNESYPNAYSLQRLVVFDYLVVHSNDLEGGPAGLHPKTPHRSGELLVRRKVLHEGLQLYQSRGLVEQRYEKSGVSFAATELSAGFLESLSSQYLMDLRERASWLVDRFKEISDAELEELVRNHLGDWGTEFALESVLWTEDSP